MISVWKGTDPNNLVFYKDLTHPDSSVVELIQEFDASYGFIDNEGTKFWFRTDLDAPKGRLIAIDLTQPAPDQWQEIIPEREDTLEGVGILKPSVRGGLSERMLIPISASTAWRETSCGMWNSPGIGSAGGFDGKREDTEPSTASPVFTVPNNHLPLQHELPGKALSYRQSQVDFDPGEYETHQVFYSSADRHPNSHVRYPQKRGWS